MPHSEATRATTAGPPLQACRPATTASLSLSGGPSERRAGRGNGGSRMWGNVTRPGLRLTLFLAMVSSGATLARGQDTHYWSIQYGPVGQLVGGQLIGGATDLSATYYNPGALALRNESSYLLSTESFQLETLSADPAPGLA